MVYMGERRVLIAGGGIGGLVLALTLDQIGVPVTVFEAVPHLKPLGVGINLQPNAVRELLDLGFSTEDLDTAGLPALEWALVGRNGREIYSEPRGLKAGYNWPQYAMHRGQFHMLLRDRLVDRMGHEVLRLGCRVTGYENRADGTVVAQIKGADGAISEHAGTLLIGADGIHSAIRAKMHPDQPPIHWGGCTMWRGTTRAKPARTGSSFIGLGGPRQRMIMYPISHPDSSGYAAINWIAEITEDDPDKRDAGWFTQVDVGTFIHHFEEWKYDWLDVPKLLLGAETVYENPMIDRDPVSTWHDGSVVLMGDAAHAMYPTGSNGASQAILDARVLGAKLVQYGLTQDALAAYNQELCGPISELVLRNRGAGPFGLLDIVDQRCAGEFENIDEVMTVSERSDFMSGYKTAAGFAIERLNGSAPTIPHGAKVRSVTR